MTQQQFADALRVARESVARWQTEPPKPRGLYLEALKEFQPTTKAKRRRELKRHLINTQHENGPSGGRSALRRWALVPGLTLNPYCSVREATRIAVSRTMLTSAPVETVEPLSLPHIIEMRPPVGSSATDVNERVPDEMLVPLTKG